MKRNLILLLLLWSFVCFAQNDSLILSNSTKFEEGIYLTYEAFAHNQPDFSWQEVGGNIFINQQNHTAKIQGLYVKMDSIKRDLNQVWGFCRFGVPFKQIEQIADYQRFSTIKVRGRLCYYSYLKPVEKTIEIVAYNPKTGRPFRRGEVNNLEEEKVAKVFEYETGKQFNFTLPDFMAYISDKDQSLWRSLDKLSKEQANAKLYKCLLIYNDRHPVEKRFVTPIKKN